MEVVELSQSYKFEKREKYLPLRWKISQILLYLTCSLIGFAGSAVARLLENSLDQECLFYSTISAFEDKNEGKWFVSPSLTVWSKHRCYGIMFIFTISFVYGMIWTVYFFTCSVSQYRYKVKRLESFHGYGPPQRLVLPALVFNVVMTLATGPIAVDAWYGLVVFCQNLMEITNSYTCMDAARLIYLKRNDNSMENAKVMADLIRFLGLALFFAWLLNTLLMLLRIFFWPDYNLIKEINIEFRLHDKPGKDVPQLYKERVRVWRKFLREKGLTGAVLQSIKEIEFTFPCLIEEETCDITDDYVYTNEDAFNLAFTESSTTATEDTIHSNSENQLNFMSVERLQLSKRRKISDDSELGIISEWVGQELGELVDHITPITNQDGTVEIAAADTSRTSVDSSGSENLKRRKDPGAGSSKSFRNTF